MPAPEPQRLLVVNRTHQPVELHHAGSSVVLAPRGRAELLDVPDAWHLDALRRSGDVRVVRSADGEHDPVDDDDHDHGLADGPTDGADAPTAVRTRRAAAAGELGGARAPRSTGRRSGRRGTADEHSDD